MTMHKRKGFTLAELIITLGILTILMGALFFTISSRDSSHRELSATADQLMSDIRYARQRAIMDGERVQIVFDGANNRFIIRYYTARNNPIRVVYLPDGVWFLHNNNRIYHFRPRGTPSSGFSIVLRSAYHRLTLSVVGSGGRVRINDFREVG